MHVQVHNYKYYFLYLGWHRLVDNLKYAQINLVWTIIFIYTYYIYWYAYIYKINENIKHTCIMQIKCQGQLAPQLNTFNHIQKNKSMKKGHSYQYPDIVAISTTTRICFFYQSLSLCCPLNSYDLNQKNSN